MGKYPILQTLSGLARFVGWIALIIAAIILFVGISKVLGALSEDSRPTNDPALYQGILQSFAALGMALTALILILVGELIKVFVDIEGNTSETTRLLRVSFPTNAVVGAIPEQTASGVGVARQDRPIRWSD